MRKLVAIMAFVLALTMFAGVASASTNGTINPIIKACRLFQNGTVNPIDK